MNGPDPYLPGHGDRRYAVEHYDLDLRYRPGGNHLDGRATLRLHTLERVEAVELDLYRLRVRDVVVEGARVARWTHRSSRVRIRFTRPVAGGRDLVVRIAYSGSPRPMPGRDGLAGWEELTDGVIVAAQPHGAPSWFPCNDRMDDKARYRVTVTTDADYHVVANGTLTLRERVGRYLRWVYEHDSPMAPYLATVQLGRYATASAGEVSGVPVRVLAPPRLAASARTAMADQPRMLTLFEDLFGPYPFEGYTVVVTDDPLEIPLESQSLSTFGRNHLSHEWEAQRLVAHELSHQWFGNAVTASRLADIWLHEGFACYAEWLWSEECGHASAEEQARRHHDLLASQPQDLVLLDPGADRAFDDRVYKRGALALHALRRHIGDDPFFDLLRTWVATHRYGSASTSDFEDAARRAGGEAAVAVLGPWLRDARLPAFPSGSVGSTSQGEGASA